MHGTGPGNGHESSERAVFSTFPQECWGCTGLLFHRLRLLKRSNKQEELEAIIQQDGYDLVAITEMWWDNSHDWHAVIDGYRLFRKDRPTRRGGGVTLYVREQLECTELGLGANEEQVENLWVRIKG